MSDLDRVSNDQVDSALSARAPGQHGKDVAGRAADLADDLYAKAERQRRRESLDDLLDRDSKG